MRTVAIAGIWLALAGGASGAIGCSAVGERMPIESGTGAGLGSGGTTGAGGSSGSSTSGSSTTTTSSGSTSAGEQIQVLSGNGEVVLSGWPGTDPLLVAVTKNGNPVANETVAWTMQGAFNAASNIMQTFTDPTGQTSITVVGDGFPATTSWLAGTVTATLPNKATAQFIVTAAYPGPPVGMPAISPLVMITSPATSDLGTEKAGTVLPGRIQAIVVAQAGPDTGQGIPNVGLRLASGTDWTKPAAGVTCVPATVLSDATGKISCDVKLDTTPGAYGFQVVVGGYNLHGYTITLE